MNSSNGTYLGTTKLIPFKLYELVNEAEVKFGDVPSTYLKVGSISEIKSYLYKLLFFVGLMCQLKCFVGKSNIRNDPEYDTKLLCSKYSNYGR